jgi:uncharacterized protein (DUF1330 family)
MYRSATLGLTAILSAALGATAMQTLHAQATPHAFIIVENAVTDQDAYNKEYGPVIVKAVEDHGGKILVRGGKTLSFYGESPKSRVGVIQFQSLEKAQAFADSRAAKEAVAIGRKYAALRWFAVEGVSQ